MVHPDLEPPFVKASHAKRAILVYRTAKVALDGRDKGIAAEWLKRDAQRAGEAAKRLENQGDIAATQLNFQGKEIGKDSAEAQHFYKQARELARSADASVDAAEVLYLGLEEIGDRLDAAMESKGRFESEARRKREKQAAKVDPPSAVAA